MTPWKVLFLCVGNSCRSQMAEAIARQAAADILDPSSAGISPLGRIADSTRVVLLERGISMDGQRSKGLNDSSLQQPDLFINMTGLPGTSLFTTETYEDWDVKDPFGDNVETYRRICDDIAARVLHLAARLRRQRSAGAPEKA
jgi:arsenate reductase (thioredoxin)